MLEVISLSGIAPHRPEEDRPPTHASEIVRKASAAVVRYLPSEFRPTLVLLDARQISAGMLDGLLGCARPDQHEAATELVGTINKIPKQEEPLFLAIVIAQPSLQAWGSGEWRGSDSIKEREFLIRLFESYRLAFVIPTIDGDAKNEEEARTSVSRCEARISRCLHDLTTAAGWTERLDELKGDLERLCRAVAERLGEKLALEHFGESECTCRFIRLISWLDQFGKRPIEDIQKTVDRDAGNLASLWWNYYREGSFGLHAQMRARVNGLIPTDEVPGLLESGTSPCKPTAEELYSHLYSYRLLRDCARWLGDGASPWARELRTRYGSKAFRALFIDEQMSNSEAGDFRKEAEAVFNILFDGEAFQLDVIGSSDGALPTIEEVSGIGHSIVEIDRFFSKLLPKRITPWNATGGRRRTSGMESASDPIAAYDVIFCEVDYRKRFVGPQIVQKLSSYLDRVASQYLEPTGLRIAKLPALIVLTHMDNIGYVHQCLNVGAHSAIHKERMFQIPSRMKRAVEDAQAANQHGSLYTSPQEAGQPGKIANTGSGTAITRERFGQHSNFRSLYFLRPDRTALLRSRNIKTAVIGGRMTGDNAKLGRGIPDWDQQDRDWVRSLPKADLHCHFGTSITLDTIEALAFNTCGHFLVNWTGEDIEDPQRCREMLPAPVVTVFEDLCRIVLRAAKSRHLRNLRREEPRPAAIDYYQSMEAVVLHKLELSSQMPAFPFEKIVQAIMDRKPPVKEHIVASLLVAISACVRQGKGTACGIVVRRWDYLKELEGWCCALARLHKNEESECIGSSRS